MEGGRIVSDRTNTRTTVDRWTTIIRQLNYSKHTKTLLRPFAKKTIAHVNVYSRIAAAALVAGIGPKDRVCRSSYSWWRSHSHSVSFPATGSMKGKIARILCVRSAGLCLISSTNNTSSSPPATHCTPLLTHPFTVHVCGFANGHNIFTVDGRLAKFHMWLFANLLPNHRGVA